MITIELIQAVGAEVYRQDEKWGEQNWPDGTAVGFDTLDAQVAKDACDKAFSEKNGTFRHILAEEVAEAFAESDPEKLKTELIQVAAVALQWCQAIDRRSEARQPVKLKDTQPAGRSYADFVEAMQVKLEQTACWQPIKTLPDEGRVVLWVDSDEYSFERPVRLPVTRQKDLGNVRFWRWPVPNPPEVKEGEA